MSDHLVFVIDRIGAGGAGGVCLRLARALHKRGVRASIIALKAGAAHELREGDDVHVCKDYTWIKFPSVLRRRLERNALVRKLHELAPGGDTTRFHSIVGFLNNAHKALHASGLPQGNIHYSIRVSFTGQMLNATKRGRWRRNWVHHRLRSIYKDKSLVVLSDRTRDEMRELGIHPARSVVICNPFDIEEVRRRAAEPAQLPTEPYIVHMGREFSQKRHDVLFAAFQQVKSPVKLALLGRHSDRMRERIAKLGLTDRIIFGGFQKNPYPWIANAKLLVLSSDYEGFSNSLMDAMICGTPAVSTDCMTGPREILLGDLARCLVPMGDADALAAKIDEVLADPPDVSNPLILAQVDEDVIADRYLALGARTEPA